MSERRWELLPHFVVRSTGFPFDWLERLAFVETEACLDAVDAEEHAIAQMRDAFIAALRRNSEEETARLRRRWCERASRHQPVGVDDETSAALSSALVTLGKNWNARLAAFTNLEVQGRETFTRELRAHRASLLQLVQNEWFQEAVWLSSPHMLQHGLQPYVARWDAERRPSEVRRVERQLVAYLQRVCAKNETTSFFGPINYGDFRAADGGQPRQPGATGVQRREAFIAYWGVAALASALAADPSIQPYLRPSISPLCRLHGDAATAHVADSAKVSLSAMAREFLPLVDGTATASELASVLHLPLVEVVAELHALARAHVVLMVPKPPVTETRPLAWLRSFVADLPGDCPARAPWLVELCALVDLQTQFGQASLKQRMAVLDTIEHRFQSLTGLDPRRKGGELYADRLLVYEECVGGVSPLSLGPSAAAELTDQLAPVLDLFAAHACATQAAHRARGAERLARMAPDGGLPFLQFVAALGTADDAAELASSSWSDGVRQQIERQPDARQIELDVDALPAMDRSALEREVLVTSPDVLLLSADEAALRRGEFRVIVGECHDTLMLWGWPLALHSDGARLERAAADLLERASGQHHVLANVLASKRVKITPFEYPGPTIEVLATSQKPLEDRIPVAQLTATIDDGQPVLRAPGRPPLRLYNGELPSAAHSLFGLPRVVAPTFGGGTHTPRLVLGKAIIQRERWCLPRADLLPGRYPGTSFELMRDWHRARRRLGLPRFLFARVAGERKPILVDSSNYFLLELLESLAKPGTDVVLTEMLPTPDQFWLRDSTGAYCAELRLSAAFATPAEVAAGA